MPPPDGESSTPWAKVHRMVALKLVHAESSDGTESRARLGGEA